MLAEGLFDAFDQRISAWADHRQKCSPNAAQNWGARQKFDSDHLDVLLDLGFASKWRL